MSIYRKNKKRGYIGRTEDRRAQSRYLHAEVPAGPASVLPKDRSIDEGAHTIERRYRDRRIQVLLNESICSTYGGLQTPTVGSTFHTRAVSRVDSRSSYQQPSTTAAMASESLASWPRSSAVRTRARKHERLQYAGRARRGPLLLPLMPSSAYFVACALCRMYASHAPAQTS